MDGHCAWPEPLAKAEIMGLFNGELLAASCWGALRRSASRSMGPTPSFETAATRPPQDEVG